MMIGLRYLFLRFDLIYLKLELVLASRDHEDSVHSLDLPRTELHLKLRGCAWNEGGQATATVLCANFKRREAEE